MSQTHDAAILSLFEQALDVAPQAREQWLAQQDVPTSVMAGVQRLLAAEQDVGDFLDTVVCAPATLDIGPAFPSIGERLGSYELLRPLAAGGMGVVYLGRRADDVYHQDVAIKLIRSVHLQGDPGARAALVARFEDERMILAQLNHPNIARILDGGSTEAGVPYLVMEHVDGQPLDTYCNAHGLDVSARLQLLCKVCDGVQEAHRNLIVHRDIKPDNILVTAAGEPRLIDFGIARELTEDAQRPPEATLYSAMTPAYASPEQIRRKALTTSSDVYSLGIVLYQIIAGRRPYSLAGLGPADLERTVCEAEPPSLRHTLREAALESTERQRRLAQVDDDLERIVAKALHKEPERRYGSASALADDLRRHLAGQPVQAHPDSTWYRARKFVQRHRLGVGLSGLALLAILIVTGVAFDQAVKARQAAVDTQRANDFLVEVMNLSDPYETGGELSLDQAMERAWEMVDTRFSDRPELAADLRLTLAETLLRRGRVDEASMRIERTVAETEAAFGLDAQRSVQAMVVLASLRREQGRKTDAERLYLDALTRLDRASWTDYALHSRVLNDLGLLYLINEDFSAAQRYLQRSSEMDARVTPLDPSTHAQTLANLAQAARGLGEYDRAESLYAQAEAIFAADHPEGSPQWAIVLNNRANLARRRNQPGQALELQRRAVDMHRQAFSGDHVMVLVPTINLTRTYVDMDRPEDALPYAVLAEAMAGRLYTGAHNYRILAITALADTQRALGRFTEADRNLHRAELLLPESEAPLSTAEYVEDVRDELCQTQANLSHCPQP